MIIKNKIDKLVCVECKDFEDRGNIEKLFFFNLDLIIYVLDRYKLCGILTLGDFKRSYPEIVLGINWNSKRLLDSANVIEEAETIFEENTKIKRIPVISKTGELLYELSSEEMTKAQDTKYTNDFLEKLDWFMFYIEKKNCKKIGIIEKAGHENWLSTMLATIEFDYEISILNFENFNRNVFTSFDLIIESDELFYKRRKALVRKICRSQVHKFVSPNIMIIFKKVYEHYIEQKNEGVRYYFFEIPSVHKLTNLTERQLSRINANRSLTHYCENSELYNDILREIFGDEDYNEMIDFFFNRPQLIKKGDSLLYSNYKSKNCNIIGGYRITLNKKLIQYEHDINVYGPCIAFGMFVKDGETIQSYLQDMLNDSDISFFYVNNYGIIGADIKLMLNCMCSKQQKRGDVVICLIEEKNADFFQMLDHNYPVIDLSAEFSKRNDIGEFFIDKPIHCNYRANKIIAEKIYEVLINDYELGILKNENIGEDLFVVDSSSQKDMFQHNQELEDYLLELQKVKDNSLPGTIGAIVMNCNPFTNGHRYLIERAAADVDQLYIFVVEENKSFFPFEDRLELVKAGTKDLKNVKVLPSGKFIISSITFPDYFQKDSKQEVEIDTSLDIEVFGQYIAPALGITIRFVGEEPLDYVTRQYNECMKRILPSYNIQVNEISRLCYGEVEDNQNVISASKVRNYMKQNQWNEIRTLVPKTTYDYLISNYN